MNDNEILETGALCSALLSSLHFSTVVTQYEMTIAADILATKPEDKAKREELYASLWGARGLLAYMKLNSDAASAIKDKLNNPNSLYEEEVSSEEAEDEF